MQVSVYQDETLLGTAILEHLDPPMGVAFGPFMPSDQYDRDKHANTIEGKYVGDKGQTLSVRANQHDPLKTASVAIEYWADAAIGNQLTVWFQDGRDFAALFSTHNDYKAYYAR
jgi:hypothetical protein